MLSRHFLTCAFVALTVGLVAADNPDTAKPKQKSLQELIDAVRWPSIGTPSDAYQELFAAVDNNQLAALERHPDTSIALQAAWETTLRSLTPAERKNRVRLYNNQAISRFLGFLEGRTRSSAPPWWRDFVLDYYKYPRNSRYHYTGIDDIRAPIGTTVELRRGKFVLNIAEQRIEVPQHFMNWRGCEFDFDEHNGDMDEYDRDIYLSIQISGAFTDTHCFIAVHDDWGGPHDIACVDRKTGKIVWIEKACGCWEGGATGIGYSFVSVVADENQVVVYGGAIGFYVHCFDAVTGRTLFKFSTWNNFT